MKQARTTATIALVAAALLWTFAMVLLVRNAHAATVTLSNGASCEADGFSFDRKTRNVTVKCASVVVTDPPKAPPVVAPPPAPPPVVTPPVVVVTPPPADCGSPYTAMALGGQGASLTAYFAPGQSYAIKVPTASGLFGLTTKPETPGGIRFEIAMSPCPGDFEYYKTPAAKYVQFGGLQAPCGSIVNPESPGVRWGATKVPTDTICVTGGQPFYINVRVLECPGVCPMYYFWNGQSQ